MTHCGGKVLRQDRGTRRGRVSHGLEAGFEPGAPRRALWGRQKLGDARDRRRGLPWGGLRRGQSVSHEARDVGCPHLHRKPRVRGGGHGSKQRRNFEAANLSSRTAEKGCVTRPPCPALPRSAKSGLSRHHRCTAFISCVGTARMRRDSVHSGRRADCARTSRLRSIA